MNRTGLLTDGDLVRFHQGEDRLFSELIEEYSPRLQVVVRSYVPDSFEARDLVQETWRQIYAKRASYAASGPLLHWCCAICRNVCLAWARRRPEGILETWEDYADGRPGSAALSPDTLAERAALRRAVSRALSRLPSRERAVLIARLIKHRSTRETAEALNCAEGTVKATLHHAVRKMQIAMKAWEN